MVRPWQRRNQPGPSLRTSAHVAAPLVLGQVGIHAAETAHPCRHKGQEGICSKAQDGPHPGRPWMGCTSLGPPTTPDGGFHLSRCLCRLHFACFSRAGHAPSLNLQSLMHHTGAPQHSNHAPHRCARAQRSRNSPSNPPALSNGGGVRRGISLHAAKSALLQGVDSDTMRGLGCVCHLMSAKRSRIHHAASRMLLLEGTQVAVACVPRHMKVLIDPFACAQIHLALSHLC